MTKRSGWNVLTERIERAQHDKASEIIMDCHVKLVLLECNIVMPTTLNYGQHTANTLNELSPGDIQNEFQTYFNTYYIFFFASNVYIATFPPYRNHSKIHNFIGKQNPYFKWSFLLTDIASKYWTIETSKKFTQPKKERGKSRTYVWWCDTVLQAIIVYTCVCLGVVICNRKTR